MPRAPTVVDDLITRLTPSATPSPHGLPGQLKEKTQIVYLLKEKKRAGIMMMTFL
jgi:hypothetical protein